MHETTSLNGVADGAGECWLVWLWKLVASGRLHAKGPVHKHYTLVDKVVPCGSNN